MRAAGQIAVVLALATSAATAAPQDFTRRLEAQLLLQTLNADLLSHDSATGVLQAWCDAHGPAGRKIVARQVLGADKPLPEAGRILLGGGAVRYRRVQLACGDRVLSEADNWYLVGRLTLDMNPAPCPPGGSTHRCRPDGKPARRRPDPRRRSRTRFCSTLRS